MSWTKINTQNDISNLMNNYGNFHDSCIVEIKYKSGNYVTNDKVMHFENQNSVIVVFNSQWYETPLELCFSGVRIMNLIGIQDNYSNDLYDCYLELHKKILPHKYNGQENLIVWADGSEFDISELSHINLTSEPSHTFIISNGLQWRLKD
jgi:hypothetical protein